MVLFVADMHLGRSHRAAERTVETDLVSLLRSTAPDLEALYLVGDVFDHYIEYRRLVPKGFVRLLGTLADLTDRGIPVTYLLGNHDPWHIDYFRSEIGIRVEAGPVREPHCGRIVYVHHGDGFDSASPVYNWMKPVLRHPLPVWIYRNLLPGDVGMRLARWYSTRLGNDALSEKRVADLRRRASDLLSRSAVDVVVFGHSHAPDCVEGPDGTYLNPGCWYLDRTVGVLDDTGIQLMRWNGEVLDPVAAGAVDTSFQTDETV